ncbi:putative secreted lipase [Golovinomyces cichoracearum]|uniref:Carboxylic ester hydrolase n=1 Tax=Golovinomyces cichoracearum TaxID=62708 RepID=A0A420IS00_9PEZI|nr:putative secreted lipase [Golovinomyces cichoracearum]
MLSILFLLAGLLLCCRAVSPATPYYPRSTDPASLSEPEPDDNSTVLRGVSIELSYATVLGSSRHGIDSFRGIPYAKPPVGPLRLRRPEPITQNLGTVDASILIPNSCPQQFTSTNPNNTVPQDALQQIINSGAVQRLLHISEDCLTLTVQKPHDATPESNYPVVYSLFFGGFGFGSTALYDASKLIQASIDAGKPIVYVAVNYRLGAFGWLGGQEILDAGLANLGHYDQILGLQWVQDNIAKFGGDPSKVTLFGTSAGSISAFNLLVAKDGALSYNGKPLFRAAIMDSGSIVPTDAVNSPKPQNVFDQVVGAGGCSEAYDKIGCLRDLDYPKFLFASTSVPGLFDYQSVALSYIPRPDGDLLTASMDELAANGKMAPVPFIIGDQEDEGTLFSLVQKNITTTEDIFDYLKLYFFNDASDEQLQTLINLYPDDPAAGSPFNTGKLNNIYPQYKRLAAILGDMVFTMIRRVLLEFRIKNRPDIPVYSYISSYGYGTPIMGTFHVTDVLPAYGIIPGFPTRSVQNYYINFICDLDPNSGSGSSFIRWPAWNEKREVINFRKYNNDIWDDDFRIESSNYLGTNRNAFHF